ncbi:ABC transporter permease [Nitratifractor salsuginis]|uniref:Binding-protein-dependent transport systems inner membrane component n=1 Tax=Nitratifractor salsuginis (strain DSM 16511 / JCM 12458 / E9I37-1) TaxID=749222 RepID=E6WZ11_NITSE|nr:ABC transporter permease [Nitratifractor salsuginis]ADV45461.1 binding-protein-dependent transport systems inner membrane component [Nitratifractor salsuginis DSM 16511]
MSRKFLLLFFKKLLYLAGMLWLISLITFGAIHMAPNSFFAAGGLNPNMTPEAIAHLKAVYGLDKPLLTQYLDWMRSMLHLDFGVSFASGNRVIDEIKARVWITLGINLAAMLFIFALAFRYGIRAALKGGNYEKGMKQLALLSYATPSFYLALLLILIFGLKLGWFPMAGLEGLEPKKGLERWLDIAWHLVLPVGVIVFTGFGSLMLYIRSLTREILKSDYIFFARARGLEDRIIVRRYIYPNLMPFIVTILGLSLPGLLGGSVILEQIFSIDGMGMLFYQSALARDYPVIMGILVVGAFLTLLGNMIADLVLLAIDPHRRR